MGFFTVSSMSKDSCSLVGGNNVVHCVRCSFIGTTMVVLCIVNRAWCD